METIIVRGPYSQSGFGVACQGLIKVLKAADYDVRFIPMNTNPQQHEAGYSDTSAKEMNDIIITDRDDCIKSSTVIDVGSLIYGLTVPKLECNKSILYCTTETTDIHPEYVQMMNEKFDVIWTATNFNKVGFIGSGVTTDIQVLPHLIDTDKFNPDVAPLKIKNKRSFNFVVNVDFSYRKGIHLLLPVFMETFDKTDDVSLIVKITNNNFKDPAAPLPALNELLFAIDAKNREYPPILFMTHMLDDTYIPSLYTAADCYVSPNLGEGFGLPIAESMACGLAQITSRCGGPLDFVNKKRGYMISLDEQNSTQPIMDQSLLQRDPHYQGRSIFNINPESLKEHLLYAYNNPDECKEKGIKARECIIKKCSLDVLKDKVKGLL